MLLWDVDTQVDFISPAGRLYVSSAQRIVPTLRRLTNWAGEEGVPVIASACAHLPGDPELKDFGPHCMAGTPGQQKIAETLLPSRLVVPNHPIELPDLGAFQQIILEKQAFDVFTNPNAGKVLRRFGENPSVVLYGVATDICVAATALSLLARGHRVRVVVDAIAALEQKNAEAFFREFRQRGGELIQAETIVHRRAA